MMKPALAALLLLSVPVALRSEEAPKGKDWSHHMGKIPFVVGYADGKAEAEKAGKPMMVFVTTTWCKPCKMMADQVFTDERVVEAVKDFVPVLVDGDAEAEVLQRFKIASFPFIRFQSAQEKPLGKVSGFLPADRFLQAVAKAKETLAKRAEKQKAREEGKDGDEAPAAP